jgi:hypothetical protein
VIQIKHWTKNPSGQVLLATLLFCFVFAALFIGLYKSGMFYTAKERAIRAGNLTALSAGAIYANGLQLVRLSNVVLLLAAIFDIVVIAAALEITGGLSLLLPSQLKDPNTRKLVQDVQSVLFGINQPIGIYPLLISEETLSVATQNGLKNSWPSINPLSWSLPIPPSPILIFNITTLGSDLAQAIVPNMALKFRTANFFSDTLPKPKRIYKYKSRKDGTIHYLNSNEVELAPDSQNKGQMRVKKGIGLEGEGYFVAEEFKAGLSKLNTVINIANLLAAIQLDVTDRDIPAVHNIFVYASYPTSIKNEQNNSIEIQTLSQINVFGTGLAAWNVTDPPYQCTLAPTDPVELVKQLSIQTLLSQALSSIKLPSISNIFGTLANDPI